MNRSDSDKYYSEGWFGVSKHQFAEVAILGHQNPFLFVGESKYVIIFFTRCEFSNIRDIVS